MGLTLKKIFVNQVEEILHKVDVDDLPAAMGVAGTTLTIMAHAEEATLIEQCINIITTLQHDNTDIIDLLTTLIKETQC